MALHTGFVSGAGLLELQVDEGLKLPAGGLVLPWPYAAAPGKAMVNGKSVAWEGGELRILSLPVRVSIDSRRAE